MPKLLTALQTRPHYQPFDVGWVRHREGLTHLLAGRADRYLEICAVLLPEPGLAHVVGLCGLTYVLPFVGRAGEAIEIADDAMTAARCPRQPVLDRLSASRLRAAFAQN